MGRATSVKYESFRNEQAVGTFTRIGIETQKSKKTIPRSRLVPSDGTLKQIATKSSESKPKLHLKKSFDWKTEIAQPQPTYSKVVPEDGSRIINSRFPGAVDDGYTLADRVV
ncbi:hypothetical protein AgCh_025889 [Apium graveolens]